VEVLLSAPTARKVLAARQFRSAPGGSAIREHCPHVTRAACRRATAGRCERMHFRPAMHPWTQPHLGACACRRLRCPRVHMVPDAAGSAGPAAGGVGGRAAAAAAAAGQPLPEPQWVCCDVRKFDLSVLGASRLAAARCGLPHPPTHASQHRWA